MEIIHFVYPLCLLLLDLFNHLISGPYLLTIYWDLIKYVSQNQISSDSYFYLHFLKNV